MPVVVDSLGVRDRTSMPAEGTRDVSHHQAQRLPDVMMRRPAGSILLAFLEKKLNTPPSKARHEVRDLAGPRSTTASRRPRRSPQRPELDQNRSFIVGLVRNDMDLPDFLAEPPPDVCSATPIVPVRAHAQHSLAGVARQSMSSSSPGAGADLDKAAGLPNLAAEEVPAQLFSSRSSAPGTCCRLSIGWHTSPAVAGSTRSCSWIRARPQAVSRRGGEPLLVEKRRRGVVRRARIPGRQPGESQG